MNTEDLIKPKRPPRSVRPSKQTAGHLMKMISTLSTSQDNADRDKEKMELEKVFHYSDKKLDRLVEENKEDLLTVMQVFRKVHLNIGVAESNCLELKEILLRCKKLLPCKSYELKKFWLEALEHKHILTMLTEVQTVIGVPAKLEMLLKNEMYLEATELLVSSINLLDGCLEGVDALKELKSELFSKREEFHKIFVLQPLHTHLYSVSSNYILKHFKEMSSSRQQKDYLCKSDLDTSQDSYSSSWSHSSWNSNWNSTFWAHDEAFREVDAITKVSICNLVNCVTLLHRIPETVEILKDRCQQELLDVAWRTSQQVAESTRNIEVSNQPKTVFGSLINKEQQYALLDLLELIFEQFRCILRNHVLLLKHLRQKAEEDDRNHYDCEITGIWSKMQTVLEMFLREYVDDHNLTNSAPQALVTSATDNISAYFLRKRVQKPKNYSLFKFDRSLHAMNSKAFLKEHQEILKAKGEIDAFDSETKVFVCPPSHKNITTIYRPLEKFINDIKKALSVEPSMNCPLHTFMTNCANSFTSYITVESARLVDNVVKGTENWKAVSDIEKLQCLGLTRSVLDNTVYIDGLMREFKELAYSLPGQGAFFINLTCSMLVHYRDYCQALYSSLVQPPSKEKRIISFAWATDSDISRLLRSLPNYSNFIDIGNSDSEELPEEVCLRNKKESEILIANLSDATFISQFDILSDIHRLNNLGLLHESLDWLAYRLLIFMESFPNKSNMMAHTNLDEFLFPVSEAEVLFLVKLQKEFEDMADTCLLVLHLKVRLHCFYYLQSLAVQGCYATELDSQEPDPEILKLNSDLVKIEELLQVVMGPAKTKYIFEGLGELISTILINSASEMKKINENGVNKMIHNIHELQHNLTRISLFEEVALDRARVYFGLLKKSPEEILNLVVEQGPQLEELEYSSIFHLLQRSEPCSDTIAPINQYLERLHQILNEVSVYV